MDKVDQHISVKVRDRVTFDTDEGILAGYVNDLRRDLGNGELHAWVELDHLWPGYFRAVPVSAILTADQVGPPSTIYTDTAWTKFENVAAGSIRTDDIAQLLARAERALSAYGFIDRDGDEWDPSKLVTFRYACEIYQKKYLPTNKRKTRIEKLRQLETLYLFFDNPPAPLDDIKPIHIRQFMDWRIKLTQDKLRKEGKPVAGREGEVAANREKALISHVWNASRDSGLTDKANPCAGIKAYKESGRDVYVYDDMYSAVWKAADAPLQEAMDLTYLSGARPADVLKIDERDLREGSIEVQQNKTTHKQRITIEGELAVLIERILKRKRAINGTVVATRLLVNEAGQPLTYYALRSRFDKAREAASIEKSAFQFRDLRAKAGTDKTDSSGDIRQAQKQLGHASVTMTEHYVRKRRGDKVTPTR